jgi:septation ring formation regulator EzrA
VYEGSVEFRQNFEGEGFKKGTEDWQEEMKKLNEDFQNGKITAQEYKEKFAEIQNKIKSNISTDPNYFVTVNAGYKSSITDANKPTDPEPFDTNADRWWEDINK